MIEIGKKLEEAGFSVEFRRGQFVIGLRAMTPDKLRHCLDAIGWSQRQLARVLDQHEGTVRQWARGTLEIPEDIATWLERLAAAHEANPVPGARVALRAADGVEEKDG